MKQLVLLFFVLFAIKCQAQPYQDSIRKLRVLHFAELTDPTTDILNQEEIDHFEGLDYFLIDTSYIVQAIFEKQKGKRFKMPTSTEREVYYRPYGKVIFELNGSNHQLTIYQNLELKRQKEFENYLFLPFRDETSGLESYGGGRYLDLTIPKNNTIELDFNICYNPYCAYSERYSCPIPPAENKLKAAVKAGEKTPKNH